LTTDPSAVPATRDAEPPVGATSDARKIAISPEPINAPVQLFTVSLRPRLSVHIYVQAYVHIYVLVLVLEAGIICLLVGIGVCVLKCGRKE